jgi:hypothetical protein
MIEIRDLLARYNNPLLSLQFQKESIKEAVSCVVGLDIKTEDIEVKDGTVFLNIKPIYKSEIFLKKEKLQAFLDQALGKKSPSDIR